MRRTTSPLELIWLVLGAPAMFATTARAWEPLTRERSVWPEQSARFQVDERGSGDLGEGTEAVVREAFADWAAIPCTSLTASFDGRTEARANPGDGRSVIGWADESWSRGSSVIGTTFTLYRDTRITEADVLFNGVDWAWSAIEAGDVVERRVHAPTIVRHEVGHFLGIGHSESPRSVMFASYGGGARGLGPDDQLAICALYPGAVQRCEDDEGCGPLYGCVEGECQLRGSWTGRGLCAPCTDHGDCGGPDARCLPYPAGDFCGRSCAARDCPSGYRCVDLGDSAQCVRIEGGVETCEATSVPLDEPVGQSSPPPAALGSACLFGSDCRSGLCALHQGQARCTLDCADAACPPGFLCDYLPPSPRCWAAPPTPGDAGPGGPAAPGGGCSLVARRRVSMGSLVGMLCAVLATSARRRR